MAFDPKTYIAEQRAKGVPDAKILSTVKSMQTPAPERGIAGEIIPTIGAIGGGIVGGILGAPVSGIGAIPGAIGGSAVGGAGGEAIQQGLEKVAGERTKFSTPQIVASGVLSAAGEGFGRAAGVGLTMGAKAIQPKMLKLMSYMSGYADNVVEKALTRTPGVLAGVREGEASLNKVILRTAAGVQKLATDTLKESQKKIAEFSGLSGGGKGYPGTRAAILKEGKNFLQNIGSTLRSTYNIGVDKNGVLLFERGAQPSRIVSGGEQKAIQEAYNTSRKIYADTSIKNIDAVLERLIVLQRKTPSGTPTGGETKAIIKDMTGKVLAFVKSLEKISPAYKQYADFLQENLPKRVLIADAKDLFGSSANLSAEETSKISVRLLQLFNDGKLALREGVGGIGGVEQIGKAVGEDIVGTSAGTLIKTGGTQFSARAPNLSSRGIVTQVFEMIPRATIKSYVETGKLVSSPLIITLAKGLGMSAQALSQEFINLMASKKTR